MLTGLRCPIGANEMSAETSAISTSKSASEDVETGADQPSTTAADRFGRSMFAWQDQLALDGSLPPIAVRVGTAIRHCVNKKNGTAWPSQAWIARVLSQWKSAGSSASDLRNVRRGIKALSLGGHLSVIAGRGRRAGNHYRPILLAKFSWPTLERSSHPGMDDRTILSAERGVRGHESPANGTVTSAIGDTHVPQNHTNYSDSESVITTTISSSKDQEEESLLLSSGDVIRNQEEESTLAREIEYLRSMLNGQMPSGNWDRTLRAQYLKLRSSGLDFTLDIVPAVQEAICDGKIHEEVRGLSWFGARAKTFLQMRLEQEPVFAVLRAEHMQGCYNCFVSDIGATAPVAPSVAGHHADGHNPGSSSADDEASRIFHMLGWRAPTHDQRYWFAKSIAELPLRGLNLEEDIVPLVTDAIRHGEVPDGIKSILWFWKTQNKRLKKRRGRLPGL
jgi:hypothetical protein